MAKETTRKIEIICGEVAMTFTPSDIEAIWKEWLAENPGKTERDMPSDEFADRCMKRMIANARPTRTIIHN